MTTRTVLFACFWLYFRLTFSIPSAQDIGLCGLAGGINWTTTRGVAVPYSGWTCTALGYANNPCKWTGIQCSGGKVSVIQLHYLGLTGTISTQIGQLTSLRVIRADVNSLNGTLPTQIGSLNLLQYFGISTNRMHGSIPTEIGQLSSLKYFLLYNNLFTGAIPDTTCRLQQLSKFYPCDSNGQGCSPNSCIPFCISSLSTAFNYGRMALCSAAPTQVPTASPSLNISLPTMMPTTVLPPTDMPTFRPTSSPYIDPSANTIQNTAMCALSGSISWTTSSGTAISHYGWRCSGSVAIGLCSNAGARWEGVSCNSAYQVVGINLFNYDLKGVLPAVISTLTSLTSLDLHHNRFYSTIPASISALTNLQYLALSDNSFTGTIPAALGSISSLMSLYIFGNSFTGSISASLCPLSTHMVKFFPCNGVDSLKCRDLSGCVPRCLLNVSTANYASLTYCSPIPTVRPTPAPT